MKKYTDRYALKKRETALLGTKRDETKELALNSAILESLETICVDNADSVIENIANQFNIHPAVVLERMQIFLHG
jgi:hypothetical protein